MCSRGFLFQKDEITQFWNDHAGSPLSGRNHILASLCPQVYGLYVVKLAVAMVLAGGVQVKTTPYVPSFEEIESAVCFGLTVHDMRMV